MNNVVAQTFIRHANLIDIPAMVELLSHLFAIEADFHPDPAKQARGLERLLRAGDTAVWVAESHGQVVGMITVQTLISTAEGGPVGLVEDVVVREGWRGLGLGTQLMGAAEDWAAQRGLLRLQLLADRENTAALAFYGKQGWNETNLVGLRKTKPCTSP